MPEKIPHSADGIEEYDNPIPSWLMWILYTTIVIAVVYLVMYPGFWKGTQGWTSKQMYEDEMAAAAIKWPKKEGSSVDIANLVKDKTAVIKGKEIFTRNCAACHGADATGGIGPNLTDKEWIYGGTPGEILTTVTNGTDKGMPKWGKVLGGEKIGNAVAYVYSLGGGSPEGTPKKVVAPKPEAKAKPAAKAAPVKMADMTKYANAGAIAEGKDLFTANCVACHGADATGGMGPNLTDATWLYGGGATDIQKTVTNGTAKGMPAWGQILGPEGVGKVGSYVHSLGGGV